MDAHLCHKAAMPVLNSKRSTGSRPLFRVHPATATAASSTSSVSRQQQQQPFQDDLVACAHRQLLFLTLVHSGEGLSARRPKVASLRRYVDLWLPLVAKCSKGEEGDVVEVELIPPADVAWLWHVHRLAPRQHVRHIRSTRLVGNNDGHLDANPPFALQIAADPLVRDDDDDDDKTGSSLFQDDIEAPPDLPSTDSAEMKTRKLWEKDHPDEPFFLDDCDKENKLGSSKSLADETDGDDDTNALVSGYDLLAAAARQSTFLWQVSRSCFRQDNFLREGVDRHHKFLLLWKSARNIHHLIPTYQIDILWHSHMLSSTRKYDEDCRALIGCEFYHDDRSEGSTEHVAFLATKSLWERTYGTKHEVEGAMCRGPPPASCFSGDLKHDKTKRSGAGRHDPHTAPGPPRETFTPIQRREARLIAEQKEAQCKLFFFGFVLIGLALLPLLMPGEDCSDCNEVDPCPDNEKNDRPDDFAKRMVVAVICLVPGSLLVVYAFCWKAGAIKPSDGCIRCLTEKGRSGGGCGGGGGCGCGGC